MAGIYDTLIAPEKAADAPESTPTVVGYKPLVSPDISQTQQEFPEYATAPAQPEISVTTEKNKTNTVLDNLNQKKMELFQAQKDFADKSANIESENLGAKQEALDKVAQTAESFNSSLAAFQDETKAQYNQAWSDIQNKRIQLEQMQPKTFWQKGDTADKIGMSIAIMMGALGQGLSGAQRNAAVDAMNTAVNQDLEMQYKAIDKKMQLLQESRLDINDKMRARQQLENEMVARRDAAYSMIGKQLDAAIASTGDESIRNNLMKEKANIDMQANASQLQTQQALAGRITETVKGMTPADKANSDAEKVVMGAGAQGGQSSAQWKGAALRAQGVAKQLDSLDKSMSPAEFMAVNRAINDIESYQAVNDIPIIGKGIEAVRKFASSTEDIYKNDPAFKQLTPNQQQNVKNYIQSSYQFTNDLLRGESGAAIGVKEFADRYNNFFTRAESPSADDVMQKNQYRRDVYNAAAVLGGMQPVKKEAPKK